MAFVTNSLNFPNLTAKGTPVSADLVMIADSAASNSIKQATVGNLPFVQLAGSTMTGALILNADPVTALGAVTKQYADAISAGLDIKAPAYAGTTATLNATYLNGAAGIGASLTNAGALAAFSIDGVSPPINSRILVKNQSSSFQNGIYTLTTVGSGAVAWILVRATDYDQAPSEIFPGNFIIVDNGTVNATTGWIQTATVTTIGTDPITFSQFGGAVSFPITLAQGGTNANLTANNGGIFYSSASAGAILAGTATARQMLQSGASTTPAWSTATYPATTTANRLLYSSATNTVVDLATVNSSILVTDGSGVPSLGTAIPNGVTATTQAALDNSTKVATTAYVNSAVTAGGVSALTLLGSVTASTSATVVFANLLSSTYDNYLVTYEQATPDSNNSTFLVQLGYGATPTYDAGSHYAYFLSWWSTAATTVAAAGGNANSNISLTRVSAVSSTASKGGVSGNINLYGANTTTNTPLIWGDFRSSFWSNLETDPASVAGGFNWAQQGAVTSLKFFFSSGNIITGIFKLYGYKN